MRAVERTQERSELPTITAQFKGQRPPRQRHFNGERNHPRLQGVISWL